MKEAPANMSNQSSFTSAPKRSDFQKSSLIALPIITIVILIYTIFIYSFPCLTLVGAKFRSVEVGSTGLDGGTMYPTISFRNGTFLWSVSDMVIIGNYECRSGEITASASYNNRPQTVQLNSITGILLWNGERYKRTFEPAPLWLGDKIKAPD